MIRIGSLTPNIQQHQFSQTKLTIVANNIKTPATLTISTLSALSMHEKYVYKYIYTCINIKHHRKTASNLSSDRFSPNTFFNRQMVFFIGSMSVVLVEVINQKD